MQYPVYIHSCCTSEYKVSTAIIQVPVPSSRLPAIAAMMAFDFESRVRLRLLCVTEIAKDQLLLFAKQDQ